MLATTSELSVCPRIADRLAQAIGAQRYSMWFSRTAQLHLEPEAQRLHVRVPNRFVADWITRHFTSHLHAAARAELEQDIELVVTVDPAAFPPEVTQPPGRAVTVEASAEASPDAFPARSVPVGKPSFHGLKPPLARSANPFALRYRLEDFIVGPSNELAFAAATRLAGEESPLGASPLFIHGGVGLGKTHLLQGICQRMLANNPQAKVLYTTGEQFTNEFLTAVRSGKIDSFRNRIRRLDLLAVDDIRFIADKQATQQEFLHSFNAIELTGARIVLASDCHPKMIQEFSEALVSRCVKGMVVEIRPPDTATRLRIVQALAARRGLTLLESVAAVLAQRCTGSVRDIEGTLTKLHALAALIPPGTVPASGPLATERIGHTLVERLFTVEAATTSPARPIRFDAILGAVMERLGLTRDQILRADRHRQPVLARALVVYLTRQLTGMSYPEIAHALGKSSHSAMIAADQRLVRQIRAGARVVLHHPQTGVIEQIEIAALVDQLKQAIHHPRK